MTQVPEREALSLDIGGSHVTAARVSLQEREILTGKIDCPVDPEANAEVLLDTWAAAALEALDGYGPPARIGIAVPSPFDHAAGVSWMTHKFAALYGISVREGLKKRWAGTPLRDAPLAFGNDADLFTLGEWWGGAARGAERVIGVTLGTGLGSGFVAGGQIITAGLDVPPGGELWRVSFMGGVAEDFASGRAVTQIYESHGKNQRSAAQVAALADAGDELAWLAFKKLGTHLGGILLPWVAHFRPDCVVIGGNVARAWKYFQPALEEALPGRSCRVTRHFEDSALLGAAALGRST